VQVNIDEKTFFTSDNMKVLRVFFDHNLSWQIEKVVNRGKSLNSGLNFIRSKLLMQQFIKELTTNSTPQFIMVVAFG